MLFQIINLKVLFVGTQADERAAATVSLKWKQHGDGAKYDLVDDVDRRINGFRR
jgi:hypothetical protein